MSSLMSSFAPQTVTWEPAVGLVPVVGSSELPSRLDGAHELPAWKGMHVTPSGNAALVRQRFYPAQLRRLLGADLRSMAANRKHRLVWSGWDRSLPRLYLPVEALMRLIMEAFDGITRACTQAAAGPPAITIRIESPRMTNATLVIALDADQWTCDDKFRGALNARWFRQSSQAHLWQRLARQCDLVGGWLSVAGLPGGGTSLLINLPTDQPHALVVSFLHRMTSAALQPSLLPGHSKPRNPALSLYAIGRSQIESLEQLSAANIRLQSLARDADFIYRVSHGRWIWLTMEPELPNFMKSGAWVSQLLDRWTCGADAAAIGDVARQVERRFMQLMGSRVPPIDLHTHQLSRGPVTARRPNTRVDNAVKVSNNNHLQHRSHTRASQPKWRYPI